MTKIEALEKTIYNLENDVYEYNWWDMDKCNCGVLARTVLGGEVPLSCGLTDVSKDGCGFGGIAIETFEACKKTGIPLPKVFEALRDCGFNGKELDKLEDCGETKGEVITYLRKWVNALKKKEGVKNKQPKPERIKTVYVSVPETIKEQSQELIMS